MSHCPSENNPPACYHGYCQRTGKCVAREACAPASPQPAAQPEQPEPGVLTEERIEQLAYESCPPYGAAVQQRESAVCFARAIEREVLSTRKLSDEQVARIMEAVDTYGERRWTDGSSDLIYQPDKSLAARADIERLLRGEA